MIGSNKIAPRRNLPPLKMKIFILGAAILCAMKPLPHTAAVNKSSKSAWTRVNCRDVCIMTFKIK
jgi:hypothetical protein